MLRGLSFISPGPENTYHVVHAISLGFWQNYCGSGRQMSDAGIRAGQLITSPISPECNYLSLLLTPTSDAWISILWYILFGWTSRLDRDYDWLWICVIFLLRRVTLSNVPQTLLPWCGQQTSLWNCHYVPESDRICLQLAASSHSGTSWHVYQTTTEVPSTLWGSIIWIVHFINIYLINGCL